MDARPGPGAMSPPTLTQPQPAQTSTPGRPQPSPEKMASLEREVLRLRREMDRVLRLMALLEHDLAIERIQAAPSTFLKSVVDRIRHWSARFLAREG